MCLLNISFNHVLKNKTKPKPFLLFFFLKVRSCSPVCSHIPPHVPSPNQYKLALGPPGHRPQAGPAQRLLETRGATPSALCSPSSPLPPARPRPTAMRMRTGEHVAAAEPGQQWRRVEVVLPTPCPRQGFLAPSHR